MRHLWAALAFVSLSFASRVSASGMTLHIWMSDIATEQYLQFPELQQLMQERAGSTELTVYPHPIDLNVLPHIDVFQDNGYTKEEMKLTNETKKILDPSILVTATAVRVPVVGGHSEAVNIEFENDFDLQEVKAILAATPGITVQDNLDAYEYPMPRFAEGKNDVFVGRIRRDESQANTLNLWIVADNLRKGAATNAVQIAQLVASL